MNQSEKALYHQIHPVKLLVDWTSGLGSVVLMWQRKWKVGLLITLIPSIVASGLIIQTVNLEPYKESAVGRYIKTYMTPLMQGIRLTGQVIMWVGGWYRKPGLIMSGLLVILFGWGNGLVFPKEKMD